MNISGLLALLGQLEPYRAVVDAFSDGSLPGDELGLPRYARAVVSAALHAALQRPTMIVVPRVDQAQTLKQELEAWSPQPDAILRFPEPTPLPYDRAPWGENARNGRLSILTMLQALESPLGGGALADRPPLVVVSIRALMQKTLPPRDFLANTRRIKVGQIINLNKLLEAWLRAGYRPATVVEEPGTFSRRGGILDICPPGESGGVRIELFGDEVESLRRFDLTTQRTLTPLESVLIAPACEALPQHSPRVAQQLQQGGLGAAEADWHSDLVPLDEGVPFPGIEFYLPYFYQQAGCLLDYLPGQALLLVDDWATLEAEAREVQGRAERLLDERQAAGDLPPDYPAPVLDWEDLQARLRAREALGLGGLVDGGAGSELATVFKPGPRFGGQVKPLMDNLVRHYLNGERVVVVSRQAARLAELWQEHGGAQKPVDGLAAPPPDGTITFVQGTLGDGFELEGRLPAGDGGRGSTLVATRSVSVLQLLTDGEIFGWSRPEPRQVPRPRAIAPESYFSDISPGNLVVHIEHGIGRYGGLVTRQIGGTEREYLLVTYAENDQLYVPVHQADRLGRYIGADERHPALHRLGGTSWEQTKARAQREVEEIADELLELYASRETIEGFAFSPDAAWQSELEASFPYLETGDQLRAITEVKRDMERPRPMDRLICGDVGYGKTEVALRAAFKAVMDGKQVGILVPTTVLAQQHFNSFGQRLAAFPVQVRMLSRFRSRREQSQILTDLAAGKVDIVVGTHRLLQKDVTFKELGLLIVDEEQRFGVAHKEVLKQLRTEVDVLTMTATPIPRTLYMSLTGVRDISLINTPPEERLPVQTHIGPYDPQLVRRAILREIDRGGQVFFVHNRVQTIKSIAHSLQKLVPEARIGVGHGQMSEQELERVMIAFVGGELDVLLSTSIIENGLDIPNANTIIVDRADWFGLAQLYQLRGRVGRGARRAYGFFFYRSASALSSDARARLETLAEHTELGAGYSIAMRDLEIRGAGEILGMRQHGHMAAVGFDLYTRLLARAVQQKREKVTVVEEEGKGPELVTLPDVVTIELPLDAYIPESYISEPQLRFKLYRRMAGMTSMQAIDEIATELADRFGLIPDPVDNLLYQLRVKLLASKAGVSSIMTVDGQISIRREGLEDIDRRGLQRFLENDVRVSRQAIWYRRAKDSNAPQSWRIALVQILERLGDWFR